MAQQSWWDKFLWGQKANPAGYNFNGSILDPKTVLPTDVTDFGLEKVDAIEASPGFFTTNPEQPSWGMPAMATLGTLGNIYTGLQNNRIAKENLAFQKQQWADQMKRYGEERDYNIASVNNSRLAGSGITGAGSRRPQQLTIG